MAPERARTRGLPSRRDGRVLPLLCLATPACHVRCVFALATWPPHARAHPRARRYPRRRTGGAVVGLRMERVLAALLPLQCVDGGWGPSWMYKYGSSNIKIGNQGLTTALALNAIAVLDESQPHPSLQSWSPSDLPLPQSQSQSQSWLGSSTVAPFLRVSMALSGTPSVPLPSLPSSTTPPSTCCEISKRSKAFDADLTEEVERLESLDRITEMLWREK
jgi:hypothetical protein